MKMKDMPSVDRPREKLERYGPEKLTNIELLAILLGTGTKDTNVISLARKILDQLGNKLTTATPQDLKKISGLGTSKACGIVAGFELSRRLLQNKKHELIMSPKDVWHALPDIREAKREHFVVFYLDVRNQTIQREVIHIGTVNTSLVHPRDVFEPAIRHNAVNILIAHNHPSGNLQSSGEDKAITRLLTDAGQLLGIPLIDHVIVTKDAFCSTMLPRSSNW